MPARDLHSDPPEVAALEARLDSFDEAERSSALGALHALAAEGRVMLPPAGEAINLHCHTFFSYNPYGYSPSKFAWLARRAGLAVAGIVDFDALDGVEEFAQAGALLGLKTCAGLETRVYIPEFADHVMNSPGEPGVSYHMGVGFPRAQLEGPPRAFLADLRRTSERRNRELTERVNAYLDPVVLDYEGDVMSLTPAGNATERHICLAYALRAQSIFPDRAQLQQFWAGKLGAEVSSFDPPTGFQLQLLIRAKTMKKGGPGYAQPDSGSFPWLVATNEFILAAGGIPTHTWLDGTSDGEQRIEELLRVAMATGVAAINVIPDRNYTPGRPDTKLENLRRVVAVAQQLGLLVVAGTEMNSPGHKLVDDFTSAELAPLLPAFQQASFAIYAHAALQRQAGIGYMSEWATRHFPKLSARAQCYEEIGRGLRPGREDALGSLSAEAGPDEVLRRLD